VVDESREVIGLSESEVENYLERIPQAIGDAIELSAPVSVRARTYQDATVVEIEVFPGARKPYFIKSEGMPKGVFVRLGSHTKRASEEQLEELTQSSRGIAFDSQPLQRVKIEDLDPHLLKQLYRGTIPDVATLRADRLLAIDPVTKQDFVTVGGVVLLHPNPHLVFPPAEVFFTIFKGTTTDEIVRSVDISAPLATTVFQILDLLEPLTTTETRRDGPRLQSSKFSIPPLAIREALLNAIVHRRYSANAPVKIALFDDRLEIFSPGNFPGPIDLKELGNGVSYDRNPTIANFTRRLGLVERRGLGFANILKSCRDNRNPTPEIIEGGDFVKVTLYRQQNVETAGLPKDCAALEPLRQQGIPLTTSRVKELLGVSAGTARARIKELIALKLVSEEGRGRSVRYLWQ
jgi:ATP-dependent DNA helicase RecG